MASEKLQYEIAALYSGQPEIKKAFDDFAKLNAAGAKVTRELQNLANASKNTGNAIRENRHATAQLGMQFNQLGTQVASGTSPLLAFQQQLGDVGYALSGMGGTLGKVGAFLAGPWGVAIMAGTTILSPYIAKLIESADANGRLANAIDRVQQLQGKSASVQLAEAQIKQNKAREELMAAELDYEKRMKNMPGVRHYAQEKSVYRLRQEVLVTGQEVNILQNKLDELNKPVNIKAEKPIKAVKHSAKQAAQEIDYLLQKQTNLLSMYQSGQMTYGEYLKTLNDQTEAYKRANETVKERINRELQFYETLQRIRESQPMVIEDQTKNLAMPEIDMSPLASYVYMAEQVEARNAEIKNSFEDIGLSVSDAFKGMLTAGMSWRDGMRGIINAVIDELWKLFVVKQITGFITSSLGSVFGGGGLPGVGSIMSSTSQSLLSNPVGLVGNKFANGTVNAPGGYALVGERGPEIVNLPRGSQVIPAHRSRNMGAGGVTVHVDARGSADPAAVRAQVQQGIMEAAPAIIAAAEQRTMTNFRRPRLGGAMQ